MGYGDIGLHRALKSIVRSLYFILEVLVCFQAFEQRTKIANLEQSRCDYCAYIVNDFHFFEILTERTNEIYVVGEIVAILQGMKWKPLTDYGKISLLD